MYRPQEQYETLRRFWGGEVSRLSYYHRHRGIDFIKTLSLSLQGYHTHKKGRQEMTYSALFWRLAFRTKGLYLRSKSTIRSKNK